MNKNLMPLQPADVPQTYANVDDVIKEVGFKPETSIEDEIARLARLAQRSILNYFRERITGDEDPQRFGKSLSHELQRLWRYCIGDYRMVCQIEEDYLVVLVVRVAHRSTIDSGKAHIG